MKTAFILLMSLLALPFAAHAEEILFAAPSGFAEIEGTEALFAESQKNAVQRGRLLKMYLPQYMAHQYRHGNSTLVTRQVLVCSPLAANVPVPPKGAELLARSLEGMFMGFATVPRGRMDTPAQEIEHRQSALKKSLASGSPLLYSSQRTPSAWIYTFLIHYNMEGNAGKNFLTTALSCAVLPVKEKVLFITAGSIMEGNDAQSELEWVRDTAGSFASAIAKVNAPEKK